MPPSFKPTSVVMRDDAKDQRQAFGWTLPASVGLHLLVAFLLIFGLPKSFLLPQKEEAISVHLVPPPEPEKAKADPPPPPSEAEKAKEQEAEKRASEEPAQQVPEPVLDPVVRFGGNDAGPRESLKGNSAEEGPTSPTAPSEPGEQEPAQPSELAALGAIGPAALPEAPGSPRPEAEDSNEKKTSKLQVAKTLFSRSATGDAVATTAMRNVPREVRASRLCLTELREQLLHTSPPYFAEYLPSELLKEGAVIEIDGAAFRVGGQWYDLSYRCEVDAEATKVMSFAFEVGKPVPRSEWRRRRLPEQ